MGRTSKPLCIGVQVNDMCELAEFDSALQGFEKKGHTVTFKSSEFNSCDVIIGPHCWRIDPRLKLGDDSTEEESLERQLEMMEKGIRAIKYPKEKKDAETTKNSSN